MNRIKVLWAWFIGHFDLKFLFIPIAVKKVIPLTLQKGFIGYLDIFIFGIRIIRIQKTKPWSNDHE